jgi:hypothetical protein
MGVYKKIVSLFKKVKNYIGFVETIFFYDQVVISHFDLVDLMEYKKTTASTSLEKLLATIKNLDEVSKLYTNGDSKTHFDKYDLNIYNDLSTMVNELKDLINSQLADDKSMSREFTDLVLEFTTKLLNMIDGDIKMVYTQPERSNIDDYRAFQQYTFSTLFRVFLSFVFGRLCLNQEEKNEFISLIVDEYDSYELHETKLTYDKNLKLLYSNNVDIIKISTITDFIKELVKVENDNVFFRGHSKLNYRLIPSVFRELNNKEYSMIQDLRISVPYEFGKTMDHFDILLKMQHYGLPTRLLDITTNPLVALYFACDETNYHGHVLAVVSHKDYICYPQSDRLKLLSAYGFLKEEHKYNLRSYIVNREEPDDSISEDVQRPLLHEIKTFYPAFEPRIKISDLLQHLIIKSPQSNPRISAQSGGFIIAGINQGPYKEINVNYIGESGKKILFLIDKNKKNKIKKDLIKLNINEGTLFPEISNKTQFIKNKYIL